MANRTSYPPGTFSWAELVTSDADAAKGFYTEVFGWDYRDDPVGEGMVYSTALLGGQPVAALYRGDPPPHWNCYVTVASADEAAARAAELGASTLAEPFDVLDAGRMAVIADPTGAALCLWEPRSHIGAAVVNAPGALTWNDLITPDVEAAARFYGDLFGWTAGEPDEQAGGYRLALRDGKPVAGLSPLMSEGQPVAWSTYVATDDADGVAERVKSNGGQVVVEPMDVMELGRMTFFVDPAGAALGAWQPKQFAGAAVVNEPVSFTWNELATRDIGAAHSFYPGVLGWEVEERDFGGVNYTVWKVDGEMVAGGMPMGDQFPQEVPPHWAVYFAVDDADATAEKAKQLGGQVQSEPMDIPDVGRFAVIADPQGAVFSVIKNAQPS